MLNSIGDNVMVEEVLDLRLVKGVVSEIHNPVANHNTFEIDLLVRLDYVMVDNSD